MQEEWVSQMQHASSDGLDKVMHSIRSGGFKKIVFLVGAGISVAAGFPTFRGDDDKSSSLTTESDGPTIHRALMPLIQDAEPTDFHNFADKVAYRIYTQNIDGLERDDGRTVWCHGKLSDGAYCKDCNKKMTWADYKVIISGIFGWCPECRGELRPNIILYGDELSFDFEQASMDVVDADLVICAGTSLKVYPFAKLLKDASCTLVIVEPTPSIEHVVHLGRPNAYLYKDDCQSFARQCMPYERINI